MLGSVCAADLNNVSDIENSNLIQDDNQLSYQNLEVSSNGSISDNYSYNFNGEYSGSGVIKSNYENNNVIGSQQISNNVVISEPQSSVSNTTLSGNDTTLYFKNGTSYNVKLTDIDGNVLTNQTVSFLINGKLYNRTTGSNGIASININLGAGKYTVVASYAGSSMYGSSSVTSLVEVLSTISANDVVKFYKNGTQYYAKFVDGNGNPLINTEVKFNINGVFYTRNTNENGAARLNINLNSGTYILTAYNPINNEAKASNVTVLSTINGSDITKYYKNGTQYSAVVVYSNGTPIVNKTVKLNINGVFYNRVTDENGTVRLNINLDPATYIITVYNPSNGEENSNKIVVLSKLIAEDMKTDYQAGKSYKVKVVNGQGKALANQTVKININGVIYNRVTDENGTAYLAIRLNPGTYICTSSWNDSFVSTKVVVNKLTASISILTPTVKKGDYYKVKITDKKSNNPIVNHLVIFVYNGTAYGAYSDNEGIAKIKIGLPAGSYQLITAIQNSNWYQNIQVHSTLKVTA